MLVIIGNIRRWYVFVIFNSTSSSKLSTLQHESVSKGKIEVCLALLQHGANAELKNSENKTALDLADANTKPILTGEYRKDELLEAARLGDEPKLQELLNPLNVNCHASDGRRSTPLHLASGYNRIRVVQVLLRLVLRIILKWQV